MQPYRALSGAALGFRVRFRIRQISTVLPSTGAHPLRHACATHVSIDTTNIYAEVDLQRKSDILVHSNPFSTTHTNHKRWKDDPSLLAFLRSL